MTVVWQTTSRVSERKIALASTLEEGWRGLVCWPRTATAADATRTRMTSTGLLSGRIVALFPEGAQNRHPARLHQLDLHAPVFAVADLVLRSVADDVLIAKLGADLGGDIRQFIHVVYRVLPPAGLLGDFAQQAGAGHFFRSASAGAVL